MQKDMKVQSSHPLPSEDAELRDILIAISVVAKRLATNLENQIGNCGLVSQLPICTMLFGISL